jgi:FkbM family methyltransferase
VGLHTGEDAEFYLKKGFRVIGIEAIPELCEIARKRLAEYANTRRIIILNGAIAETCQPTRFFVNNSKNDWGTTSLEWMRRNDRLGCDSSGIVVNGLPFDQVIKEYGVPYYLKIDIEGADLLCVRALRSSSSRPRYISLEATKTSFDGLLEEFSLLKELGYSKFKVCSRPM